MTNPSTAPIYELTRALLGEEPITVEWAGDETTTISDDIFSLADGIYIYRFTAYGELGDLSSTSDPYYIQIENGAIVSYPQKDINSLSVQATAAGKFLLFWKQESSTIENPTHFNIYSSTDTNPSDNPSAASWTLDGTATFSLYQHYTYNYTTTTAFENGEEVSFKVLPSVQEGSVEYEKESELYVSSSAVAAGPIITDSEISIS